MSNEEYDDFEEDNEDAVGKFVGDRNLLNQRHGKGWAILPNGDQYDGDYRKGKKHGNGLYIFHNGARYLGRYRCGRKSGFGTFYYHDGSIYEGMWKKNVRHGNGFYRYINGDIYQGSWYKGLKHSLGCYIFKIKNVCFRGAWNQGVPVGSAEIIIRNYKFYGSWDYQHPQGPGVFALMCKHMLLGFYRSESGKISINDKLTEMDFEECEEGKFYKQIKLLKNIIPPPTWYAQIIAKYDFSKLPLQPLPVPISDSDESVCNLSIDWSEDNDLPLEEPEPCELDECNLECEQGT